MLMQCPALIKGGTVVTQMVANIDVAPTVMQAMGLKEPAHMDGQSFLPLAEGKNIPWRKDFLYVYYWEKNFPQTPTIFSLRSDRYKYITYYGLWDADELYDLESDPNETRNLLYELKHQKLAKELENKLYSTMAHLGGMEIPLNQPAGGINNKRLRSRGGAHAADFPEPTVVDQPINQNAN